MRPIHTITQPVHFGIYDAKYIARIYTDKIVVVSPYVKWVGNTGGYAERRESIRDEAVVNRVLQELEDGCSDTAWKQIGEALGDDWLTARGL